MREIVKSVSTIDEFDKELFEKLNIGVEIQDYTEPNLTFDQRINILLKYKHLLQNFKGIVSLHGPFLDLKPASPDIEIRKVSQEKYKNILSIAKELDAEYLILHSQINPDINYPPLESLNNKQSKDMWEEILPKSNYKGTILIENIFEKDPFMIKRYIETIDNNQIKINLDIGHAKLGTESLDTWIKNLKDYIKYIHIHTNKGDYDTHNIPTKEEVKDLYKILDKYNINPIISLEYDVKDLEKEIEKYRI